MKRTLSLAATVLIALLAAPDAMKTGEALKKETHGAMKGR
jgi:hypothetical protein